jgi:hypothetical protein
MKGSDGPTGGIDDSGRLRYDIHTERLRQVEVLDTIGFTSYERIYLHISYEMTYLWDIKPVIKQHS